MKATTQLVRSPALAGAYGYVDSHGRIRAISVSRSDAIRNARLNGMASIVHLRTTPSGTIACSDPSPVIRWEDWRTGETF